MRNLFFHSYRGQKSEIQVRAGPAPPRKALGENPSLLRPASGGTRESLDCGPITPISASSSHGLLLRVSLPCVSHKDICHWIWGPPGEPTMTSSWGSEWHLPWPLLQWGHVHKLWCVEYGRAFQVSHRFSHCTYLCTDLHLKVPYA